MLYVSLGPKSLEVASACVLWGTLRRNIGSLVPVPCGEGWTTWRESPLPPVTLGCPLSSAL